MRYSKGVIDPATRDITITVDDGEDPIAGASVVIGGTTKTTNDSGVASFTGVTEGTVSATISKDGYTSKTESLSVDSTHTSFTVSLVAVTPTSVNISATVTSDGTTPIQGATVVLTDKTDDTKTFTGTSGSAGGCTLSNVPLGTYVVTASCEGYENYTGAEDLEVTVETDSLAIQMTATTNSEAEPGSGTENP